MDWKTITFIAILVVIVLGAVFLSSSGAMLPGPDDTSSVSMRDVQNRRSHYVRYYAFGK